MTQKDVAGLLVFAVGAFRSYAPGAWPTILGFLALFVVFFLAAPFVAEKTGRPLDAVGLRAAYYFGTLDECSWETNVGFGTIFSHRHARLGARASMGAYCVIGHADIGPGVRIGSRVSIPSGKRQHLDAAGRLSSSERFDTVAVGEGSWIGEGAILLAKVGYGCIVSAGAVVTTAVPDRSVVGGNPARVLRGPR